MYKFDFINSRGDILPLSGGVNYKLTNFDAQTSANTNLATVSISGEDGDTVNNAQAQPRTIIFDLRIIHDVEKTKREILSIIKLKQKAKIKWTQAERTVEIEGIVESVDMPRWNNAVVLQITMHCGQPFWENIDFIYSQISEAFELHYFTDYYNDMLYFPEEGIPFGEYNTTRTKDIYNSGDVSVGLQIEIVALDTVTNPIIYNESGKFFGCGYGDGAKKVVMQTGDIIIIDTRKNQKSVTLNGSSILQKVKPSSTWFQLEAGENKFSVNSDDENTANMTFSFIYKQRYI